MIFLVPDELFFGRLDFQAEIVDLSVQPIRGLRGGFVPVLKFCSVNVRTRVLTISVANRGSGSVYEI